MGFRAGPLMCRAMPSPRLLAVLLVAAVAVAGCGRKTPATDPERPALVAPQRAEPPNLGFPERATKNTTRVPGTSATALAAAVARAVFPDPTRRPDAVTLVDTSDWRVAVAASALMAPPFNAPVLFTDGTDLPGASSTALKALGPKGAEAAGKAQIIRIGTVAKPAGYTTSDVVGDNAVRPHARDRRAASARRDRARPRRRRSSPAPTTPPTPRPPRTTPRSRATRCCSCTKDDGAAGDARGARRARSGSRGRASTSSARRA